MSNQANKDDEARYVEMGKATEDALIAGLQLQAYKQQLEQCLANKFWFTPNKKCELEVLQPTIDALRVLKESSETAEQFAKTTIDDFKKKNK